MTLLISGAHLRIGDLLMEAGLARPEDIAEAVHVADKRQLPIGRALVMQGVVSERLFQAALQAQSLYRDGVLTREQALQVLECMRVKNLDLDQAINEIKRDPEPEMVEEDLVSEAHADPSLCLLSRRRSPGSSQSTIFAVSRRPARNRLGELLIAAGVLSAADVARYVERSTKSGLPLGRYLVSVGAVGEGLIMAALNIQLLIRNWKCTREQGIQALKAARQRQAKPGKEIMELAAGANMHLGELMVLAGILTASDMMQAVEVSLVNEEKIGQALLRLGLVSNEILQDALSFQYLMTVGSLQPDQAIRALKMVHEQGIKSSEALRICRLCDWRLPAPISFETFVRIIAIVRRQDIDQCVETASTESDDPMLFAKLLVQKHIITDEALRNCQRLHSLVSGGFLTLERATIAIQHCLETGANVRQTIEEFGWMLTMAPASPEEATA